MYRLERNDAEIDEALNDCAEQTDAGTSKWPGMSYEQGVEAALRWAVGESSDHPMAE